MPPPTTHVLTLHYYTCFPWKKRRRRLALIKNTDKGLFLSNPRLLKSGGNSGFPVIGGGKMNSFCLFLSPRGCEEKEKEEEGGMGFPVCRRLIRRRGGGTFNNARMFLSKQQNISQVSYQMYDTKALYEIHKNVVECSFHPWQQAGCFCRVKGK